MIDLQSRPDCGSDWVVLERIRRIGPDVRAEGYEEDHRGYRDDHQDGRAESRRSRPARADRMDSL